MFNPVRPDDDSHSSEPANDESLNIAHQPSRPFSASDLWFGIGISGMILGFILTLLPWFDRWRTCGYEGIPGLSNMYDGMPGKVNLVVTIILLIGYIRVSVAHSARAFDFISGIAVLWYVIYAVWIATSWYQLEWDRTYWFTGALAVAILTSVCTFTGIFLRKD